jgi:hypothetical protein
MKKGLIFGLIAVLSAAFLVIGCSQATDSDGSTSIQIGGRLVDYEVRTGDEDEFYNALANPAYQVIGITTLEMDLTGAATYNDVTEIPAGKTVVLYTELTPPDDPVVLTVNGTLIVEGSGILNGIHGSNEVEVDQGQIQVINGKIAVDYPESIHGVPYTKEIFGTGQLQFAGGTLEISSTLSSLAKVKTAFGWVSKGTLHLTQATDSIPEAIKPSVLAQIPTTLLRRLIIDIKLTYDPLDPDTAETIAIPAGLEFKTDDPLTLLKTLTVAGDLTANLATFSRLEKLTLSGAESTLTAPEALFNNIEDLTADGLGTGITAAKATYDKVKNLVVNGVFTAGAAAAFNSLESLTVNPGGIFFTTSHIGSDAQEAPATTITLKPAEIKPGSRIEAGIAIVGLIKKLKTSAIEGSLIATGFATETGNTLTAAAGGTINGVTFPAAMDPTKPITSITATAVPAYTVTIDDYTVPRDKTLNVGDDSTLIIPTGKILTIAPFGNTSGDGKIKAQGTTNGGSITIDGVAGYLTTPTGVDGGKLRPAVVAITKDTVTLTDKDAIDLKGTFFVGGSASAYPGIGSIETTSVTAEAVLDGADTTGDELELSAGTVVEATAATAKEGANAGDIATLANVTIEASGLTTNNYLKLKDTDWATAGSAKVAILTFSGVKLQNSGLINPAEVPIFHIGLKTKRS